MEVGQAYIITLGKYRDKYLVTGNHYGVFELRRVRLPKSKIDAVRLPERLSIQYYSSSAEQK